MVAALLRIRAWLEAHPIVGWVAAALAAIGFAGLRIRHLKGKVAKEEVRSHKARVELKVLEAETEGKVIDARREALDETLARVTDSEAAAAEEASSEVERRRRILEAFEKAKVIVLILVVGTGALAAAECEEEPDPSALIMALEAQTENDGAQAAAGLLRSYRAEREALCRRLEFRASIAEMLEEKVSLADSRADTYRVQSEQWREAYDEMATMRLKTSGRRWGWTIGAGLCVNGQEEDMADHACAAAVWGFRLN